MIEFHDSSDSSLDEVENLFFSDSSSSSSLDEDLPRSKKTRVENFIETIQKYSDEEFISHFRLKRTIVNSLTDNYKMDISKRNKGGSEEITAEKRVLVTLWYLANTNTFREISNLFDISRSSAHRCIVRFTHWLVRSAHHHIKWPKEEEQQQTISLRFNQIKNFPYVLGCIDGCHIRIPKPKQNSNDYYNRKKYYSFLLQGVVGPDKKFYDIHVGEPGSIHDSRMLRKSELFKRCVENSESLIKDRRIVLGDSAYPCLTWLIPPFRDLGSLSDSQKHFNKKHSATRVVVEHAFGLLKNRFRRLTKFQNIKIDFVVNCTIAACVLHNICIDKSDVLDAEVEIESIVDVWPEENLIMEENTFRREELLQEMFPNLT